MVVFDRLLNKDISIDQIEKPVILGRYIFKSNVSNFYLNDCKISKLDYLVPSISNEGMLKNTTENIKIIFNENDLLNEDVSSLIKHTLLDVSEELKITKELTELEPTKYLSSLKDINILLRNFDKRLEISYSEEFLEQNLNHIKEVCRDPSYHLKREISKLNVSRAKRVPVKAINYLAAHTEDWSRRKIRTVEPRKILSEVIDYDLEIYENQISTSLIYKLLKEIKGREKQIKEIENFINKVEDIIESRKRINSDEKVYWYKKIDKDYSKLGQAVKSNENSKNKAVNILKRISKLKKSLSLLKESNLYKNNKSYEKRINLKIKRTNLFDNHQHYRFVKIIWDKFNKKEILSLQQKSEENQRVVKSFIDYSWVLIFRSFLQIGFNETNRQNNNSFNLSNSSIPLISINITKNDNEIIDIKIGDKKISIIPLPATKEVVNIKLSQNTYILTLFNTNHDLNILGISPSDINSEERITTMLFKFILEELSDMFLFQLSSQNISNFEILQTWLKKDESLILDKGKNNKIDFYLKRKLKSKELNELNNVINTQKQNLSARSDIRSKQLIQLDSIENELRNKAKEHFEKFEVCISCANKNESSVKSNINGGFIYKCNNRSCEVEYGFTENIGKTNIFYKVPDFEKINTNIFNINKEINKDTILNAYGYEYL